MYIIIHRKQRDSSAPTVIEKNNPELQQLKSHLESRRAQRLSSQQRREIVSSSGTLPKRQNSLVSLRFDFNQIKIELF